MEKVSPEIPDKLFFRVGEVSSIADVPAYVLRFWETEFKGIHPKRTDSGQRLYRKKDVVLILKIKHLLYEKKYTIRGALQYLKSEKKQPDLPITMEEIRGELRVIRDLVK
jgi:DNA-binding transcriptional MerR regulator